MKQLSLRYDGFFTGPTNSTVSLLSLKQESVFRPTKQKYLIATTELNFYKWISLEKYELLQPLSLPTRLESVKRAPVLPPSARFGFMFRLLDTYSILDLYIYTTGVASFNWLGSYSVLKLAVPQKQEVILLILKPFLSDFRPIFQVLWLIWTFNFIGKPS